VIGEVEVLDTTRLAIAKVVADATVVAVEPPVLTFLTPYDTLV
jgi:hypothetical protein